MALYLIPTPIGNLGDMTIRAIDKLKEVDFIFAEDTRTTIVLLNHYQIKTPLKAYHMHNEHSQVDAVIDMLKNGYNIALVSDAGTPGISDPGYSLTSACIAHQIEFESFPGATAFVPALVLSGFANHHFSFWGFPPPKKGRQTFFKNIIEEKNTAVFYESPHKILKTISELMTLLEPDRLISTSREITKKFENTQRGTPLQLLQHFEAKPPKGEFVVCIEGVEQYLKRTKRNKIDAEIF